ncbi:Subunit of heteropentameric Replication factor C (RF-C) [Exophiala xenobiotica]|uniref:Subunit of heteropentameric Replication factor C (RF-C) n=1 Tax=Vermiconidia calcicola TaxID=1690605 RepID=A0AAV9QK55_9PEZI|nr:Subunit of heteropentameric Replication factor C (RF-C) [Exophiala xenobiotica]KAK5545223.1 Subunit of heteropentameric Replication factor C (RF-C) [Vermiconidia calcicola]KAK5548179.1 Subunit of heteropentameric Replication factor C (RF-C) [Chaetothyriales sp. CCFEE 6169]KAK5196979.1 Subunit of heteropentameric Replication factor C (RF-C) [Exophiala xenobiotica]KAK5213353.1 Subunit of heteropentameric Replication factor C (RF-C) [Exophiala xenobiotica]
MASFFDNKARAREAASASSSKMKVNEPVVAAPRMAPWVEKYRPRSLEDVRSQDHVVQTLNRMVHASNLPHLLLYGPPGTGKTSTILALCRELFGPELFHSRVLELNASDERGLAVIRERVKQFASLHLVSAPASKEYRARYPCPPFKVIILDEADSLTQDAQGALRRVMEIHSKITRFCLCCNYVSRIIDPIASRCSKFRFKALEGGQASERIQEILSAEKVKYEDGVIERALKVSDGDLRRAINLLQSAARLVGSATEQASSNGQASASKKSKTIPDDDSDEEMADADDDAKGTSTTTTSHRIKISDIDEIAGTFPPDLTNGLVKVLQKGNIRNYNAIAAQITDIAASGYAANEVLSSLYSKLIFDDLVDSKKKYKLTQMFSEFDKRLVDGVDEHLALLDLSCQLAGVLAA